MALGERKDPYFSFRFRILIDQIIEGGFTEVSGLEASTQVEDFREGGVNDYVYKLPKETTFGNLVLKKGLADITTMWNWHRNVVEGIINRTTVHIVLLKDRSDEPARIWSFKEAYPIKWSGPQLKSDGNTIAFETIEIVHHGYAGRGAIP